MGILLIVYGALMGIGGVMGYKTSKSGASLVVGVFSGILLAICGALVMMGMVVPAYIGFAWTILLCLLFARRYSKTKKGRPAGFMLVLSTIIGVVMVYLLFL